MGMSDKEKKIIDKYDLSNDRSVVVSVLDILVKANNISELEALSRIDEWKEKHVFW